MNQQIASPDSALSSSSSSSPSSNPCYTTEPKSRVALCRHRTKNGKPCRYSAADAHSGLCPRHVASPTHRYADPALASELLGDLTQFQSAGAVNQFPSRLLLLLAQDRLSPRRGAVMAYTCNLLLRSLHAINIENKIAADAPQQMVFDLPRPLLQGFQRTPSSPVAPATPAPSTEPGVFFTPSGSTAVPSHPQQPAGREHEIHDQPRSRAFG